MSTQRTFTLLSTSDTDLLSARASASDWKLGNPYRVGADQLAAFAAGTDLVVVRILGAARKYEDMLQPLLDSGLPVVVLGGEQLPDAELMAAAPLGFQLHALVAFSLFALWPFTRLVHVFSAPLGYVTRPYVVYRSRDDRQLGSHRPRRGWEKVG